MSRSYKHTPVWKFDKSKDGKRRANKKVRQSLQTNMEAALTGKSNLYRRLYETWDICDFRFFGKPRRAESLLLLEGEAWKKAYRRK